MEEKLNMVKMLLKENQAELRKKLKERTEVDLVHKEEQDEPEVPRVPLKMLYRLSGFVRPEFRLLKKKAVAKEEKPQGRKWVEKVLNQEEEMAEVKRRMRIVAERKRKEMLLSWFDDLGRKEVLVKPVDFSKKNLEGKIGTKKIFYFSTEIEWLKKKENFYYVFPPWNLWSAFEAFFNSEMLIRSCEKMCLFWTGEKILFGSKKGKFDFFSFFLWVVQFSFFFIFEKNFEKIKYLKIEAQDFLLSQEDIFFNFLFLLDSKKFHFLKSLFFSRLVLFLPLENYRDTFKANLNILFLYPSFTPDQKTGCLINKQN